MCDNEYWNEQRWVYDGGATFVRRCEICKRFVKPDEVIYINSEGLKDQPNATCSKCGRVQMIFEGWV